MGYDDSGNGIKINKNKILINTFMPKWNAPSEYIQVQDLVHLNDTNASDNAGMSISQTPIVPSVDRRNPPLSPAVTSIRTDVVPLISTYTYDSILILIHIIGKKEDNLM